MQIDQTKIKNEIEQEKLNDYNENNNSMDIYSNTSVFDFIHSQQINLECSQLDKENSHFIIADIAIASFELLKTQRLAESKFNESSFPVVSESFNDRQPITTIKSRTVSSGIKINSNHLNAQNNNSLKVKTSNIKQQSDSPSDLLNSSSNTNTYLDDNFATTSMAMSMEQDVIFVNSSCTSPNPEVLSCCSSSIATTASASMGVTSLNTKYTQTKIKKKHIQIYILIF